MRTSAMVVFGVGFKIKDYINEIVVSEKRGFCMNCSTEGIKSRCCPDCGTVVKRTYKEIRFEFAAMGFSPKKAKQIEDAYNEDEDPFELVESIAKEIGCGTQAINFGGEDFMLGICLSEVDLESSISSINLERLERYKEKMKDNKILNVAQMKLRHIMYVN